MATEPTQPQATDASFARRARAHLVHVYTASGIVLAFLAAAEIAQLTPDPRVVFALLAAAVVVDATDGPLARRWQVKRLAGRIDGRTIDDIVDYLTFTFLPLLLAWRMDWLAGPGVLLVVLAMIASLLGFANTGAKDEQAGFFLGFPSYWNIFAFYAGLFSPIANTVLILVLTALTVLPVRFVYPNLAPRPWRAPLLVGAGLWLALLLAMLWFYPDLPGWVVGVSLIYPGAYLLASVLLDLRRRQRLSQAHQGA